MVKLNISSSYGYKDQYKANVANKYIGIGVVVLAALLLIFFVSNIFGGYSNRTPEKAVNSMFKAVSKQNYKEFVSLVSGGDIDDIIDEYIDEFGYDYLDDVTKREIKKMIEDQIEELDEELEYEFGKNWHEKIKVVNVDENDGYAEVTVEIDGEEETMNLYEDHGKWYLDIFDIL